MRITTDAQLHQMIAEWKDLALKDDLNGKRLSPTHFSLAPQGNHERALDMFRFIIEDVFQWTPREALNFISEDFVDKMGLKSVYEQLIYPDYITKRSNYNYLVKLCYPNEIDEFNEKEIWKMEYIRSLSTKKALSKKSFSDINGREKAKFLLKYYLTNNIDERYSLSEKAAYEFFASADANKFLKEIGLLVACNLLFDSPLEYFHETLNYKNELYYEFNNFKKIYTEIER